jgi:hypothetical protein
MAGIPIDLIPVFAAVSFALGQADSFPCHNCPSRTCDGPEYGANTTDGGNCVRPILPGPRVIEGDDDLIPF